MAAVAASYVAVAAVYGSAVAVDAVKANETAWATLTGAPSAVMGKAVAVLSGLNPDSYADMTAVAASQTAMAAIAASSTALSAIAASTTALDAIYAKKKRMSGASASLSGKFIILQISNDNAFDTSRYGYATLSDGSKPKWDSYKDKYAYFKQYKKIATYMKNDTDSDDWIDYFQC
nr:MAG TPA: Tail fiber protein [Myoviridae sp. ctyhU11]